MDGRNPGTFGVYLAVVSVSPSGEDGPQDACGKSWLPTVGSVGLSEGMSIVFDSPKG